MKYEAFLGKLNQAKSEYSYLTKNIEKELLEKQKFLEELEDYLKAQKLVQEVSEKVQEQAHRQISSIVSSCLEAVFEQPYTFKILFEKKRGKTEARLIFERDGHEIDPISSSGGGVIDVASFALRLACLLLSKPQRRRILVLDEPFRFLSAEYRPAMSKLIETLSERFQFQVIMVTHFDEYKVGKVINLEDLSNG